MINTTAAQTLESVDRATEVVLRRQPVRTWSGVPAPRPMQRSAQALAVIAFAPLMLAAVSALLLVLIAKLCFALVAMVFEG